MACSEYMHGMTLQHSFDAVTTKRVKSSLCKGSVEHWNFLQCIRVHVTAILNLSMLRNTRNKTQHAHIVCALCVLRRVTFWALATVVQNI